MKKEEKYCQAIYDELSNISFHANGIKDETATLSNYWADKYYELFSSLINPVVWMLWTSLAIVVIILIAGLIKTLSES